MAHAISPRSYTPWKDPFAERTAKGLFSAPWVDTPSDEGIAAVQHLSETLIQSPSHPDDLSLVLGHLLAVHGHCQQAARARDPRLCRQHYGDALRECEIALARLHHSKGGTPAALAAWAQGVHTLIRAQITLATDPPSARLLAYEALHQLSGSVDPLCAGAEADALSAMLLVREPVELEGRLAELPDRVRATVDGAEQAVRQREGELNRALASVKESHDRAMGWAIGWGLLNLGLVATGPINSFYEPRLPWSLPFLLFLAVLWYATWGRPFREGLPFFTYLRMLRLTSIADFKAAARELPDPRADFPARIRPVLDAAHKDHERLARFYLFQLPADCDTCWKARAIAEGAAERLRGGWMAELRDRAPWPLAEVLPTDPSMIPAITRVWFGK